MSAGEVSLADADVSSLLKKYFLHPFKTEEYYHLSHSSDLVLNEVYSFCEKIFQDPDTFFTQSVALAKHLYHSCALPQIKSGELYVAYFTQCVAAGTECDAVGLFKSESKESFLKINPTTDNFIVTEEQGININKLDKGCLIFNLEKENGFLVQIIDHTNKSGEAAGYWKNDFLQARIRHDSFHHTDSYLKVVNSFIQDKLLVDYNVEKTEEVELKNRTVHYFKKKRQLRLQ